jgi:hypothetical protein
MTQMTASRRAARPLAGARAWHGPAGDEHGHAENCQRLAAAVASWETEWEAEP